MTKEELIFELKKRCSFWLNNKTISKKHALECLLGIFEQYENLNCLKLLDTLEQAAEEYAPDFSNDFTSKAAVETVRNAFKDGAEWMAGQGVSIPGKVGIYGVDVESITKELREARFNLGEEVILQIRKKQ